MTHLYNAKSPSLPLPQEEYNYSQQEQLLNALRLYFNRIDNALLNLSNTDGGGFLHFPHAMFSSAVNQSSTANNTPTLLTAEITNMASGVTMDAGQITVVKNGTYRIKYAIQFINTDAQAHDSTAWFKKNGTAVAYSGSKFETRSTHGGDNGHLLASTEFLVDLTAEDYLEIWWAADQVKTGIQDGIEIEYLAASVSPYTRPIIPSVTIVVTFVCAALE